MTTKRNGGTTSEGAATAPRKRRSRTLRAVNGVAVAQADAGSVRITVTAAPHPLMPELRGRAFVTIAPLDVLTDDDRWEAVLGAHLALGGGTALVVRDDDLSVALEGADPADPLSDMLVPLRVRDPYWPPADVLAPLRTLRAGANLIAADAGPRAGVAPAACAHPDDNQSTRACPWCFRRWWRRRAEVQGIADA